MTIDASFLRKLFLRYRALTTRRGNPKSPHCQVPDLGSFSRKWLT
jgi:hypothetical protein